MKTRRNFVKMIAVAALVAGTAMCAGTASAQSFGSGAFYHSEMGARGTASHLTYGDVHANEMHMHNGHRHNGHMMMKYSGGFNDAGHPTGDLHPGMVLPDGAIVVSVGS